MIPKGADSVIAVEQTRELDGWMHALAEVSPGSHVRRRGEDIETGEIVLSSGSVLGAPQLGVLASLGAAKVCCFRRPRVALVLTGDELRDPGAPLPRGTIHNSNAHSLPALVRRSGAELVSLQTVADQPQATREAIGQGIAAADVTIVCGGVSVGAHDHVRASLAALGAQQRFWGVALKPGKPTWFGTHMQTLVFGLPGNPVSAMVTFLLFVAPALRALSGREAASPRHLAALTRGYRKRRGRAHAVRCHAFADEGGWHADPFADAGSHVLTSMLRANALAVMPAEQADMTAGEQVEIELIDDLCGGQG
jgi:molybdopterin molybdotransferase